MVSICPKETTCIDNIIIISDKTRIIKLDLDIEINKKAKEINILKQKSDYSFALKHICITFAALKASAICVDVELFSYT